MILGIDPKVQEKIIEIGIIHGLKEISVFGSRARGDYRRTSDIDLAVRGGNIPAFALDIDEEVPTLLKFDIVDIGGPVNQELLHSIRDEGKIIYEKI